jgi:hypothetical protein
VPLSLNLGTLYSWNPLGHSRTVTGLLYLLSYKLVFLLQVSTTLVAINKEVPYKGWIYRDITKICELKHRCKILSFKNIGFKIHIKTQDTDELFVKIHYCVHNDPKLDHTLWLSQCAPSHQISLKHSNQLYEAHSFLRG